MNRAVVLDSSSSTYTRWYGAAAAAGGVLLTLADTIFTLTHGTQNQDQHNTLFGITSLEYARVFQPTIWLCFLLGVLAVNGIQGGRAGRMGVTGYVTSLLGYGLAVVAWISQVWIGDPYGDFQSVFVQGGFTLWLVAVFIQTIGMTVFGTALMRVKALPRWNVLPLLVGLLLLPGGLFRLFIFDRSDGSFAWTIAYILAAIPYAVCWVLLGYNVWTNDRRASGGQHD